MRILRTFILLVLLVAAAHSLFALGIGNPIGSPAPSNPVSARAVVGPITAGRETQVVVEVKIDSRYHIQSAGAPDPYIPTRLKVDAAPAVTFGSVRYPVAKQVPAPKGLPGPPTIPVYEGTIYIQFPVTLSAVAPADLALNVTLITQACDATSCLPPKPIHLSVPLNPANENPAAASLIAAASAQPFDPQTFPAIGPATSAAASAATLVAASDVPLLSADQQLQLIASRPYRPANPQEYPLYAIIFLALAGGCILNIMPCVLPVIPLKILSLVQQAHGDRRVAFMHSLAFSAGVITLFIALAVVLKTFGLFYGQQFQSPAFLIAMVLFVVALALSMLGVWTINPPQSLYAVEAKIAAATETPADPLNYAAPSHRAAFLGSFANGLMATLLATPCSAPFLGGVLAWALVQPTWIATFTLALVGVGMSLPYLVLAAFPNLLNRLPRAGRWSELLKQGLGIVMLGVAVYLVQLIPNAQLWPPVLLASVIVALVCWAWGQIPTAHMAAARIWAIRLTALLIGTTLGLGLYGYSRNIPVVLAPPTAEGQWQPFNIALLDKALAENRPVIIDWTASWCFNCRALDAAILSADSVQDSFRTSNALLLRADLSTDNPPADALNRKLGGEAIPVLAIFSPKEPYQPMVLRDSYTRDRVIDEVTNAR